MLTTSSSYPYFDPADFSTPSAPLPIVSPASSMSSVASNHWVDAQASPYSSCGAIAAQASSSQSSLWTASSVSDDEQRCLDLLDQLEDEVSKLDGQSSALRAAQWREREGAAHAGPSSSRMTARAVSVMPSVATLRAPAPRRPRRLSFTKTDLADLDIDAILEAYAKDGALPPIDTAAPPSRPPRSQLRAAKSNVSLRHIRTDIFPSERAFPRPPQLAAQNLDLHRTSSSHSEHSLLHPSAAVQSPPGSSAYDDLFPHRRVAPFPTLERKKSSTSMHTSASRRPSAADAPPVPPLPRASFLSYATGTDRPSAPPSTGSHRTFSSFARQSSCSNSSSLGSIASASSAPPLRSQAMRSTLSRDSHYSTASSSAASSSANSFRWSVATSSTAPSDTDASSRRGSLARGPLLSSGCNGAASPSPRGKAKFAVAFREDEEAFHANLPAARRHGPLGTTTAAASRRAVGNGHDDDDSDTGTDHGGLISWEHFASELDSLAPPTAAAPSPSRRAGGCVMFAPADKSAVNAPVVGSAASQLAPPVPSSVRSGREGAKASRMRKISFATLRAR